MHSRFRTFYLRTKTFGEFRTQFVEERAQGSQYNFFTSESLSNQPRFCHRQQQNRFGQRVHII
jgi:hypothetical protein